MNWGPDKSEVNKNIYEKMPIKTCELIKIKISADSIVI